MIKAVETVYKGYRFRSRLEARWAVFFDALGVRWEYEFEGYDLNGVWYLPDFWLPDNKCFCEVKPEEFSNIELNKCRLLSKKTNYDCFLLSGVPEAKEYQAFTVERCVEGGEIYVVGYEDGNNVELLEQNIFWYLTCMKSPYRYGMLNTYFLGSLSNSFPGQFIEAVKAAKSARF